MVDPAHHLPSFSARRFHCRGPELIARALYLHDVLRDASHRPVVLGSGWQHDASLNSGNSAADRLSDQFQPLESPSK